MTADPRALSELLEESQDLQADALRPTHDALGELVESRHGSGPDVRLFVAQGYDGIDLHGAPRGYVASGECDEGQDHSHTSKGQRVMGTDAK